MASLVFGWRVPTGRRSPAATLAPGELGPRRASGTYRAIGSVRYGDGGIARCDSGLIPWTAARG